MGMMENRRLRRLNSLPQLHFRYHVHGRHCALHLKCQSRSQSTFTRSLMRRANCAHASALSFHRQYKLVEFHARRSATVHWTLLNFRQMVTKLSIVTYFAHSIHTSTLATSPATRSSMVRRTLTWSS